MLLQLWNLFPKARTSMMALVPSLAFSCAELVSFLSRTWFAVSLLQEQGWSGKGKVLCLLRGPESSPPFASKLLHKLDGKPKPINRANCTAAPLNRYA